MATEALISHGAQEEGASRWFAEEGRAWGGTGEQAPEPLLNGFGASGVEGMMPAVWRVSWSDQDTQA